MSVTRVGSADDRAEWLERRKRFLGASEICGWMGSTYLPKKYAWYYSDNNQDTILGEKLRGEPKVFGDKAAISVLHGARDEVGIIRKVEEGIGFRCEPDNSQFVNDRWPHVAATVDCFMHADEDLGEPEVSFCQDPKVFPEVRERLTGRGTGILEIKKSLSVGWSRGELPPYYIPQVKTQLAVLELPWAVICAECVFIDPKEGWRKYWDLRPFLVKADPVWPDVLDKVNSEFADAIGAC